MAESISTSLNTTRLRKTFRYPDDNDDDVPEGGIDEEEQEKIIAEMAAKDAATTTFYKKIFISIPTLGLFYFVLIVFFLPYPGGADVASHPSFYVLCILSLFISLHMAIDVPTTLDEAIIDLSRRQKLPDIVPTSCNVRADTIFRFYERNFEYLNAAVCITLAIIVAFNYNSEGSDSQPSAPMSFSIFPVLISFVVVFVARRELRPVDIKELESMKYNYRGAW